MSAVTQVAQGTSGVGCLANHMRGVCWDRWVCCQNDVTQYLPHKLAEFLANDYEGVIRVKKAGAVWSVSEYNKILWENVVPREQGRGKHMHIHTFHVLEMESDLCEGIVRAAAAPFPKKGQKVRRVCT